MEETRITTRERFEMYEQIVDRVSYRDSISSTKGAVATVMREHGCDWRLDLEGCTVLFDELYTDLLYDLRIAEEATVGHFRPQLASRRPDLRSIRSDLQQVAEAEATKLYRLARRMEDHDVVRPVVDACREEARRLHMMGRPEQLLDDRSVWRFAFKY